MRAAENPRRFMGLGGAHAVRKHRRRGAHTLVSVTMSAQKPRHSSASSRPKTPTASGGMIGALAGQAS